MARYALVIFHWVIDGLYQATELEIKSHKETLDIFQQVKSGALPLDRVVVNDDGVKVMPEPPKTTPGGVPGVGAIAPSKPKVLKDA